MPGFRLDLACIKPNDGLWKRDCAKCFVYRVTTALQGSFILRLLYQDSRLHVASVVASPTSNTQRRLVPNRRKGLLLYASYGRRCATLP